MYAEHCPCCRGTIEYSGQESYIHCPYCGDRILISSFIGERQKMVETQKENAQMKEALSSAQIENAALQQRLSNTVAALDAIGKAQENTEQIIAAMGEDQKTRDAMHDLLKSTDAGQNALTHLVQGVLKGQSGADEKLETLQIIAQKILDAQNQLLEPDDMQTQVLEMLQKLKLSAGEQVKLTVEFMNWSRHVHDEDVERLKEIQASADVLQKKQANLSAQAEQMADAVKKLNESLSNVIDAPRQAQLEEMYHLYKLADDAMSDRRFEEAEGFYRKVIVKGGESAEVYWRILLCHYCVAYEKNGEGKYVPAILHPDLTAPEEMSDRKNLFAQKMPDEQRREYTRKLDEIDRILDKYRQLRHTTQYDVFISVKQNDENHFTHDSDSASTLYDYLTGKGLRVFNSRRTAIPAGQEYEPYIISALISAKVMIVVGSSAEYMNARWVKNEWSRFQWLQKNEKKKFGKTDRLLFCYLTGGMQAQDIPKALDQSIQAVTDGVAAQEKLDAALQHLLGKPEESKVIPQNNEEAMVLEQMKNWLLKGEYKLVIKKYNELIKKGKCLDKPYMELYMLCAELEIRSVSGLSHTSRVYLKNHPRYLNALRVSRDEERTAIENLGEENEKAYIEAQKKPETKPKKDHHKKVIVDKNAPKPEKEIEVVYYDVKGFGKKMTKTVIKEEKMLIPYGEKKKLVFEKVNGYLGNGRKTFGGKVFFNNVKVSKKGKGVHRIEFYLRKPLSAFGWFIRFMLIFYAVMVILAGIGLAISAALFGW